ncbi:hypothetical protein CPB84DRAFT_1077112 [Gymnopilus junonius]|uniref:Uncharacterized protein n=1 Tax=Gymnopilus junonius TaxID=109634 RepID=A0A9P5NZX9_GYMJU|nr:hypothetical protein CPB84DRAFT_1077112 [Gymnopilus junonius]
MKAMACSKPYMDFQSLHVYLHSNSYPISFDSECREKERSLGTKPLPCPGLLLQHYPMCSRIPVWKGILYRDLRPENVPIGVDGYFWSFAHESWNILQTRLWTARNRNTIRIPFYTAQECSLIISDEDFPYCVITELSFSLRYQKIRDHWYLNYRSRLGNINVLGSPKLTRRKMEKGVYKICLP